jgi:hypothetical protein
MFRKGWESNEGGCLDKVMEEFSKNHGKKLSTESIEEVTP